MSLKQIFCKHNYEKIAHRPSIYTSDYIMFSDLGYYNDVLYECTKCKKRKMEVVKNEKHPLYQRWVEYKKTHVKIK